MKKNVAKRQGDRKGGRQVGVSVEEQIKSLTCTQVWRLWGVTKQAVSQWARKDGCPRNEDGTFDLAEVIRWREDRVILENEVSPMDAARARIYHAKAEKEELDLQLRKGKLLDAEEVMREQELRVIAVTHGLECIPVLAPHLEGLSAREIQKALKQRVREIRLAFAGEGQ